MFEKSMMLLRQRLNMITMRWQGLVKIASAPYRPELHYMRGPGPKWHAKHQGRPEVVPVEARLLQAN